MLLALKQSKYSRKCLFRDICTSLLFISSSSNLSDLRDTVMIETALAPETVSVEQQSEALLGACLSLSEGVPSVDLLFEVAPPRNVKPLYTDPAVQRLCQVIGDRLFTIAQPSKDGVMRRLTLPLTRIKDIDEVLPFEAESVLPFEQADAPIDRLILEKGDESTSLQLFATTKESLSHLLESWNRYTVDPERVTPTPLALTAFARAAGLAELPTLTIHLSHIETTTCLSYQNLLLASTSTSPILSPEDHEAIQELNRAIVSLSKYNPDLPPKGYTVVGENKGQIILSPPAGLECRTPKGLGLQSEQLSRYALPIGTALIGLPGFESLRVNLRKGELAYPAPLKRFKRPLAIYVGLCASLAIALTFFGKAYVEKKEGVLRQEFIELYTKTGKVGVPSNVEELTLADITYQLDLLDGEIKSAPNLFPLQPNLPMVSDVLAWLNTHPAITREDGEPVTLESFNYTLVKRPDLKKFKEKYRAKVEVEFSTNTPKVAREIHDALLAPNPFIDPKEEVKWSSNRGKYRATFYLKDKTQYRN